MLHNNVIHRRDGYRQSIFFISLFEKLQMLIKYCNFSVLTKDVLNEASSDM